MWIAHQIVLHWRFLSFFFGKSRKPFSDFFFSCLSLSLSLTTGQLWVAWSLIISQLESIPVNHSSRLWLETVVSARNTWMGQRYFTSSPVCYIRDAACLLNWSFYEQDSWWIWDWQTLLGWCRGDWQFEKKMKKTQEDEVSKFSGLKIFRAAHAFAMYCFRNDCYFSICNFFTHNLHVTICMCTESRTHMKWSVKFFCCLFDSGWLANCLQAGHILLVERKPSLWLALLPGKAIIWMFYWYFSNRWLGRDTFCSVWKYCKKSNLDSHLVSVNEVEILQRIQTLQPIRTAALTDSKVLSCKKFLLSLKKKRRRSSTITSSNWSTNTPNNSVICCHDRSLIWLDVKSVMTTP